MVVGATLLQLGESLLDEVKYGALASWQVGKLAARNGFFRDGRVAVQSDSKHEMSVAHSVEGDELDLVNIYMWQ